MRLKRRTVTSDARPGSAEKQCADNRLRPKVHEFAALARTHQEAACKSELFSICSDTALSNPFFQSRRVMTDQFVITEKTSQAKDVRAAVGSR
jgi:hypothetical protein